MGAEEKSNEIGLKACWVHPRCGNLWVRHLLCFCLFSLSSAFRSRIMDYCPQCLGCLSCAFRLFFPFLFFLLSFLFFLVGAGPWLCTSGNFNSCTQPPPPSSMQRIQVKQL
ncbi:hypothetical protein P170DRAFT_128710 [Aspergillus steynii IBT 23096]|uniref:Uncharacterized protein n=1 Tax=Aspergillus steynii IBT 23096 TaxID=1392250 RepID=A0A2I2GKK0_9EURO|nr:uncharacterized protein P170DRAFT_128710 [Aspergillus steynii IBT 23096]PLB53377.1 hypothetical protein P170DRAFT_128710 [Aspergillus steynii IBT 23096]